MASLVILKGNSGERLDLTRFIPVPKCRINDIANYDEWVDSRKTVHRVKTDSKANGEFTLKFNNINQYYDFINFVKRHTHDESGAINCDVFCVNTNSVKSISAFLDYEPDDILPLLADRENEGFTVTLTERGD